MDDSRHERRNVGVDDMSLNCVVPCGPIDFPRVIKADLQFILAEFRVGVFCLYASRFPLEFFNSVDIF